MLAEAELSHVAGCEAAPGGKPAARSCAAFFGSADGLVRFLAWRLEGWRVRRPVLEVWLARRVSSAGGAGGGRVQWLPLEELLAAAGSLALRDPRTLAALTVAARSDLLSDWTPPSEVVRRRHAKSASAGWRLSEYALRSPIAESTGRRPITSSTAISA